MISRSTAAAPMPPGVQRRPKIGAVEAFTGCYDSVQVLHRFLKHAGFEVVTSRISTAPIIEAGTTRASADLCFPLRVYVGHVQTLATRHPDLDAILAPNVWTNRKGAITCCKYRDIGGVAIRSLWGMIPYLRGRTAPGAGAPPRILRPNIEEASCTALRNVAFNIYADVLGLGWLFRAGFLLPALLRRRAAHLAHAEAAFARAWAEVMERPERSPGQLLSDQNRPRLALVGRRYLIEDPALSADLKPWFKRHGVTVLTPWDLPRAELEPYYRKAEGFYETHLEAQAFIDWAVDKVDGFIALGSFGCHPDAFQVDYLADQIRRQGKPAWTFRFDETAGTAGFQTRFETIMGFLEGLRDQRRRTPAIPGPVMAAASRGMPPTRLEAPAHGRLETPAHGRLEATPAPGPGTPARPLFVWPYMGEELNLALEEVLVQAGLRELARPPAPIDGTTMELGSRRYAETCSPFACATGSLMQSVQAVVRELREQALARGEAPEPRRILGLMLQGEGPCTFGWYALAQSRHLPGDLAADLADGHTFELLTIGHEEPEAFFRQLAALGNTARFVPILRYMEAQAENSWARLNRLTRLRLSLQFQRALWSMVRPALAKLSAAEAVRARSLVVRAHESTQGSTTAAYRECQQILRQAHGPRALRLALRRCMGRLNAVPQDRERKPRVVSVGEIYVALTSFANRGVVENLLGREGIEVVEGITLSGFIRRTLREVQRRRMAGHPWIAPLRRWLADRNIRWLGQKPHDLRARPLMEWEIGGDGMEGVAAARGLVEQGCDGIIHTLPFKCMPEGMAKDAYKEMSGHYGVRYLALSFDKELDMERVKTEVATFASLLRTQAGEGEGWVARRLRSFGRRSLGRHLDRLYRHERHPAGGVLR